MHHNSQQLAVVSCQTLPYLATLTVELGHEEGANRGDYSLCMHPTLRKRWLKYRLNFSLSKHSTFLLVQKVCVYNRFIYPHTMNKMKIIKLPE